MPVSAAKVQAGKYRYATFYVDLYVMFNNASFNDEF